jgi:hypothetical protein
VFGFVKLGAAEELLEIIMRRHERQHSILLQQ